MRASAFSAGTGPVPAGIGLVLVFSYRLLPGNFSRRWGPVPEARYRPVPAPRAFLGRYRSVPAGTGPVPALKADARIWIPAHHHL
jgi:hypothetical protein